MLIVTHSSKNYLPIEVGELRSHYYGAGLARQAGPGLAPFPQTSRTLSASDAKTKRSPYSRGLSLTRLSADRGEYRQAAGGVKPEVIYPSGSVIPPLRSIAKLPRPLKRRFQKL